MFSGHLLLPGTSLEILHDLTFLTTWRSKQPLFTDGETEFQVDEVTSTRSLWWSQELAGSRARILKRGLCEPQARRSSVFLRISHGHRRETNRFWRWFVAWM